MNESAQENTSPILECDLVMKGGVASGLVYARTFTVLSGKYRFRSIAGSSAGAIAAAFVAAAEYARQGGDPTAFTRLREHCEALPALLPGFFQAEPRFRPLMKALIHIAPGTGRARFGSALISFWRPLLTGALVGLAILIAVYAAFDIHFLAASSTAIPGLILSVIVGAVVGLAWSLRRSLLVDLPMTNFGLCAGLGSATGRKDITNWTHAVLQEIAFGAAGRVEPLTFGDLANRGINLRIIAANLNFSRMEVLPDLSVAARFLPAEWARLFPDDLMAPLNPASFNGPVDLPTPGQLPVLVAVRMSIACPGLLEAVPARLASGEQVLFADGGLVQNFPFEIFDEQVPERPTLAFDLATLRDDEIDRLSTVAEALDRGARPARILTLRDFLWSLIVALREGATRTAMMKASNRDRIFQAWLRSDEGGMDLDMSASRAQGLMAHGEALGNYALTGFDFAAHRARRREAEGRPDGVSR